MEILKRYQLSQNILLRFKEDIDLLQNKDSDLLKYHRQFRKSAIQSFKFSVDILQKLAQDFLAYKHTITIDAPTPRSIFRELIAIDLLTKEEFEQISRIIADRNITSHTYNEILAEEILYHLNIYYELMQAILNRLKI